MPTVAVVTEDDLQAAPGQPAAGGPVSLHFGAVIQRLRKSLDRVAGQDKAVDKALEEACRLPNAQSRLQILAEKLVQAKAVDFACVSLISSLSAFALIAIHGPGADLFPPPVAPCNDEHGGHLGSPRRSFSLFHSRRLFQLEGSGWSLQEVAASATPWYYDCSEQNVHGQPKEAAWLHVAGMRSMVCLPCIHDTRVCGAILLASRNRTWYSKLLNKLQDVVLDITPLVVQAASDLAPCLSRLQAHRFKTSNEIAAGMMWEMVNLDKILLTRINADAQQEQQQAPACVQAKSTATDAIKPAGCAMTLPVPEPIAAAAAAAVQPPAASTASSSCCSFVSPFSVAPTTLPPAARTNAARSSPYMQVVMNTLMNEQLPVLSTAGRSVSPAIGQLETGSTHGSGCAMSWSSALQPSLQPLTTNASSQRHGQYAPGIMDTSTTVCSSSRSSHQATHVQVVPVMTTTAIFDTDVDPLAMTTACYGSEHLTANGLLSGNAELLTSKLRTWADNSNSQLYSSLCSSGRAPVLGYDMPDLAGMGMGDGTGQVGRYVREKTQDLMSRLRGSAAYVAAEQVIYEEKHLAAEKQAFMMQQCQGHGGVGLDMTDFIMDGVDANDATRTTGAAMTTMACVSQWEQDSPANSGKLCTLNPLMDSRESVFIGIGHGSPRPSLHHQHAMLSAAMDCVRGRGSNPPSLSPTICSNSRATGSRLSITARFSTDNRDANNGATTGTMYPSTVHNQSLPAKTVAASVAYQSSLYSSSLTAKAVAGAGGVMSGIAAVHAVERCSHLPTLAEEGR